VIDDSSGWLMTGWLMRDIDAQRGDATAHHTHQNSQHSQSNSTPNAPPMHPQCTWSKGSSTVAQVSGFSTPSTICSTKYEVGGMRERRMRCIICWGVGVWGSGGGWGVRVRGWFAGSAHTGKAIHNHQTLGSTEPNPHLLLLVGCWGSALGLGLIYCRCRDVLLMIQRSDQD